MMHWRQHLVTEEYLEDYGKLTPSILPKWPLHPPMRRVEKQLLLQITIETVQIQKAGEETGVYTSSKDQMIPPAK